jgi:hypothetical protein
MLIQLYRTIRRGALMHIKQNGLIASDLAILFDRGRSAKKGGGMKLKSHGKRTKASISQLPPLFLASIGRA